MRIALCSTFVPFIHGGARNIVEWLEVMLREAGHQVERIYLPEVDSPDVLYPQMAAFRFIDLSAADRVICFRPQSHLIRHDNKIVWFIHHLRSFYDLWDTDYRGFPDDLKHRGIRESLRELDTTALREARHLFTNSQVVADRLKLYNGLDSEPLFPPVFRPERFQNRSMNDEIVYVCRLEHHKRQHLLIDAMSSCRSPVKLRLCGTSAGGSYPDELADMISKRGLGDRVLLDDRWISEEEKVERLADCLAAAYVPLDEDSYGYPTLEAGHSQKAILTTTDAGGVLEFVIDGRNGLIAEPTPESIARAMDRLYEDREATRRMGQMAQARIEEMQIGWKHVLERLLS
jgi:glycosyltransferase involved in cell wall biosynthesis